MGQILSLTPTLYTILSVYKACHLWSPCSHMIHSICSRGFPQTSLSLNTSTTRAVHPALSLSQEAAKNLIQCFFAPKLLMRIGLMTQTGFPLLSPTISNSISYTQNEGWNQQSSHPTAQPSQDLAVWPAGAC